MKIFVTFAFRRCGEILCVMCQPSDWCLRLSVPAYMPETNTVLAQTICHNLRPGCGTMSSGREQRLLPETRWASDSVPTSRQTISCTDHCHHGSGQTLAAGANAGSRPQRPVGDKDLT